MRNPFWTLLHLLLALTLAHSQSFKDILRNFGIDGQKEGTPCFKYQGDGNRMAQHCMPGFENAAYGRQVIATNTCGFGRSARMLEYCWQTGITARERQCNICNATDKARAHLPKFLTDKEEGVDKTWWQSDTMIANVQHPNMINLTIDLGGSFEVTYISLRFKSSRPESFAIYKRGSLEEPWVVWQFYSSTCEDMYNKPTVYNKDALFDDTLAVCSSEYSDISPLTGGSAVFMTLQGRPGAYQFDESETLQNWVTARYIRITLNRINTFGDEVFGDDKVLKSYFYAISDLSIGGRCQCHGHASLCEFVGRDESPTRRCKCGHNTAGDDCSKCLPFYQNKPWGRATSRNPNVCEKCDCKGMTNQCEFDRELYERTGNGGRCIGCQRYTDGVHCEKCLRHHYRLPGERGCAPCLCHPWGATDLQCAIDGQCICHPGVTGKRCDQCLPGYWGLREGGCRKCECNEAGSSSTDCNQMNGQCSCKAYVVGKNCDQCMDGYFYLRKDHELGCTKCACFGHSAKCSSALGYTKEKIESDFYYGSDSWLSYNADGSELQVQYDQRRFVFLASDRDDDRLYFHAPEKFLSSKSQFIYDQLLTFRMRVDRQNIRASREDIILEANDGRTISTSIASQGNNQPTDTWQEFKFRLNEHQQFGWSPQHSIDDFLYILGNLKSIKIRGVFIRGGKGFLDWVRLQSAGTSGRGEIAKWIPRCECPVPYTGTFCEQCNTNYRRAKVSTSSNPFEQCIPCSCNGHASSCNKATGHCFCQHETAGNNCERCEPGYYGNALNGTAQDCRRCPCPNRGPCSQLNDGKVFCHSCPQPRSGKLCEYCMDGFYGDPAASLDTTPKPCQNCECSGNIDSNAVGNCNTTSGECLKCIYNTFGWYCDKCLPGFYGDARGSPKGEQCKACDCYPFGTHHTKKPIECDQDGGQCYCKPNVEGKRCDKCEEGYFNITSNKGCAFCDCDAIGSVNTSCHQQSGQCHCKQGVVGLKCNKCAPLYYGFSYEGCKPCDCDPAGSKDVQCGSDGQCICKNSNIVGRTCDQCAENKFNLSANCPDCPPCYNLIQGLVNRYRQKLKKLKSDIETISTTQIIDPKFNETLLQMLSLVVTWHNKVKKQEDLSIPKTNDLSDMIALIEKLHYTLTELKHSAAVLESNSNQTSTTLTMLNDIGSRLDDTLLGSKTRLEVGARELLPKLRAALEQFGIKNENMTRLADMAQTMANQRELVSKMIKKLADDAHSTSTSAKQLIESIVVERKMKITQTIDDLDSQMGDLRVGFEQAMSKLLSFKPSPKDVSLDISELALNISQLKVVLIEDSYDSRAADVKDRAITLIKTITDLQKMNSSILIELNVVIEKVQRILKSAEEFQEKVEELAESANKVDADAMSANQSISETLERAKETLIILENFDKQIEENKGRAELAKEKIDEIRKKLNDSSDNVAASKKSLSETEADVDETKVLTEEAKSVAVKASNKTSEVREKATEVQTKANTETERTVTTESKLTEMSEKFEEVNEKFNKLNADTEATAKKIDRSKSAVDALEKAINEANEDVKGILDKLKGSDGGKKPTADEIDELNEKVDQLNKTLIDARTKQTFNQLKTTVDGIAKFIYKQSAELPELAAQVANIRMINATIPDNSTCWKDICVAEGECKVPGILPP